MASVRVDIVSIGTLSRNRLWGEGAEVRTAHATTTLIRAGKRNIIVDPGLPAAVLGARLGERTGVRPEAIDTVFLTNLKAANRAGVGAFGEADVYAHELEIEGVRRQWEEEEREAELKWLDTVKPAEDKLAAHVDLFPLFGYTAGTCGLLVAMPTVTILIAGDAVPTQDHFLAGQVLEDAQDIEAAQESMREVYEIADLIVPGHDNVFLNPRTQGM